MSNDDKQILEEIKNIALISFDTLEVISAAIESDTVVPTTLLGPINLLKKELMDSIVYKIDDVQNI